MNTPATRHWIGSRNTFTIAGAIAEYAAGGAPASPQKEYGYRNGQLLVVGTGETEKIVFQSVRDGNYEIYTMNADGSSPTRITNNSAADEYPVWSPDNSKIAFTSSRDGNREIYVMNADGTNQTRLTTATGDDQYPAWAPDGSKLTFRSYRDGNDEIYSMNADGTGQTRLTNNPAFDLSPDWSPDGTKIIFYTNRTTNFQIYVMNADGSGQTSLSNNTYHDLHPAWSPDGSKIAFYSNRDGGNREIYVMNANGSGPTRLMTNSSAEQNPAWSRDGNKLAFFSDRDGNWEVYTMNAADGSNQTRLTNSAGDDTYPDWPKAGNAIQWLVADHLGTPRIVIEKTGSLAKIKRHDYLPFGEELYAATGNRTAALGYGADSVRQKFTSKERDNETGLDYFGARYYASMQGRFTSPDPLLSSGNIHDPQTWNRYSYTVNNPLMFTDPLGLFIWGKVSDEDKERIRRALGQAKTDLEKIGELHGTDSNEYLNAKRAYDAYGAEGVDNGVTVTVGVPETKGAAADTDLAFSVGSKTKSNPTGQKITITFTEKAVRGDDLVTAAMHEGSHAADGTQWVATNFRTSSRPTTYQTEFKAFTVTSLFAQAAGPNSGYGFQLSGGGIPGKNPYLPERISIWNSGWKSANVATLRTANINKLLAWPKYAGGLYQVTPRRQGPGAF